MPPLKCNHLTTGVVLLSSNFSAEHCNIVTQSCVLSYTYLDTRTSIQLMVLKCVASNLSVLCPEVCTKDIRPKYIVQITAKKFELRHVCTMQQLAMKNM